MFDSIHRYKLFVILFLLIQESKHFSSQIVKKGSDGITILFLKLTFDRKELCISYQMVTYKPIILENS